MFDVGSIVRAKRGSKRCRAMVATVGGTVTSSSRGTIDPKDEHESETTLCILWEPIYPKNLITEGNSFLITPKSIRREPEQDEATVTIDTVEGLLSFEIDPTTDCSDTKATTSDSIALWKERGDKLLRLGDASAATSHYEKALFDSSSVSIGGTVIISVEGFPRIADVDCVDDDDDGATIDVTLLHNDNEKTVKQSAVLLSLLEYDATNIQERILLNLARCMLQLSDLDISNRPKYLKAAVLATTLAITISLFREEPPPPPPPQQQQQQQQQQGAADVESLLLLPTNAQTALVLRCKAYTGLSKWSKATSDAQKLVKRGSNEEQGRKLLVVIDRKKKLRAKTDKKLAKEICLLVQSATTTAAASNDNDSSRTSVSLRITTSARVDTTTRQTRNALSSSNTKDKECSTDWEEKTFSNSRSLSILRLNLGFSSTCVFIALVVILISIFMANVL